ncbi:hypothetical protein [Ereboglobus luteus]|uniref:Uncharacterized protein n=1 Tax=Ereboglobus luteus TaxID=1796921 RepID=A0A2U8E3V1_9BACT|nr:hypothetical protein [Ereboglobus luteus]AWI09470.1 hypothetical protein CKA38_09615 [Ereboglobus luteus]
MISNQRVRKERRRPAAGRGESLASRLLRTRISFCARKPNTQMALASLASGGGDAAAPCARALT